MSYLVSLDKALAEGTRQYSVGSRMHPIRFALRKASVNDNFAMTGIVFFLQGWTYKMMLPVLSERPRQCVLCTKTF